MTLKIAINGFGRIGRGVLRAMVETGCSDIEVVAINDLAPAENIAHLLKYDSVHGRLRERVAIEGDLLIVGNRRIRLTAIRTPEDLPWHDVDIAYECTGLFTSRDQAARLLQNGSKRVLISAPGKDADRTVVYGVNHRDLRTFDVDLSLSERIMPHLPASVARVAESGVKTGEDAARLRAAGADAVLVGTSLMREGDPGRALAKLRRETAIAVAALGTSLPA